MLVELKNKNCLIFGANSYFGKKLAKNLSALGMNLGLVDLDYKSSDLAKKLENAKSMTVISGNEESFKNAVKDIKKHLGSIDYLICSYYFEDDKYENLDRLSMEKWDKISKDWLHSYFLMSKAVLPYMDGKGKILFVNTTAGYTGEGEGEGQLTDRSSFYHSICSSAITGMMTSIARDIIPLGIKVNGIAINQNTDEERVLNTILFLLSDLSDYACGQIIRLY